MHKPFSSSARVPRCALRRRASVGEQTIAVLGPPLPAHVLQRPFLARDLVAGALRPIPDVRLALGSQVLRRFDQEV
jgi:hypothetical protein